MTLNYYEMLGLERDATRKEIARAYRAYIAENHPDRTADMDPVEAEIAENLVKSASAAYNVLSNPSKRADYDRELDAQKASPQPSGGQPRRKVNLHGSTGQSDSSMLGFSASDWQWHSDPGHGDSVSTKPPRKRSVLIAGRVLSVIAGIALVIAWGLASIRMWQVTLAASGVSAMLDPNTWLWTGALADFALAILTVTGWIKKRWTLIALGAVAAFFAVSVLTTSGWEVGSVQVWAAALMPVIAGLGSVASTVGALALMLHGLGLSRRPGVVKLIDSEQFTTQGSVSLGKRPRSIDMLISALVTAFDGRAGVRVIILPDRVSVPQVKTQAIIIAGRTVHLVSIPPLGDRGFELAGSQVVASGMSLRNVVLDEVAEVEHALRGIRHARVYGYVVPTEIGSLDLREVGPVTYASLSQVIDQIGTRSGDGLDTPDVRVRHAVSAAVARLLSPLELGV